MHIISLYIREFGAISDRTFSFEKGLNLIEGENESGKSTIIGFIRFLFYGLDRRSAPLDADRAFSRRSGTASGNMKLSYKGEIYRLERHEQSGNPEKHLLIVNETTGVVTPKGTTPEAFFLGFPKDVFDSTVCVRQLRGHEISGESVSASMENLLLSGDEALNADKALELLERVRRSLLHKNGKGGEVYRARTEIQQLRERLRALRTEAEDREATEKELTALRSELESEKKALLRAERTERIVADTALLRRFDALRDRENDAEKRKEELRLLRSVYPFRDHESPETSARQLEHRALLLDSSARDRMLALQAKESIPAPSEELEALRKSAETIRDAGGTEHVLGEIRALLGAHRRLKTLRLLLLVLSVLSLSALSVTGVILGNGTLLSVGIGLGAVLLAVGLFLARPIKEKAAARSALLSRFGISPSADSPETAFASFASRVFREQEEARLLEERRADAEKKLRDAVESEARLIEDTRILFDALLKPTAPITPSLLRDTATSLRSEEHAIERKEDALQRAREELTREKAALSAYREEELRNRIPKDEPLPEADPSLVRAEIAERKERVRALEIRNLSVSEKLSALRATVESPDELLLEIERKTEECNALEARLRAILLASESIETARISMRASISPRLRDDASRYLSRLSESRYGVLAMDRTLIPSSEADGVLYPIHTFSGGTQDIIYLSLRFALADLFGSAENPLPLLFDEALSQLDDVRASAVLRLLLERTAAGGQILLFTCHTREGTLLSAAAEGSDETSVVNRITL